MSRSNHQRIGTRHFDIDATATEASDYLAFSPLPLREGAASTLTHEPEGSPAASLDAFLPPSAEQALQWAAMLARAVELYAEDPTVEIYLVGFPFDIGPFHGLAG